MNKKEQWGLSKLYNKDKIILVKCGAFYKTYEEDALIIWNIFKYKLSFNSIGFPVNSLFKIVSKLNRLSISVVVINDKDNVINYDSKLINKYSVELNKSLKKLEIIKVIEEIGRVL